MSAIQALVMILVVLAIFVAVIAWLLLLGRREVEEESARLAQEYEADPWLIATGVTHRKTCGQTQRQADEHEEGV